MYNNRSEPIDHWDSYEDAHETIDRLRKELTEAENLEAEQWKEIKALRKELTALTDLVEEAITKAKEEATDES